MSHIVFYDICDDFETYGNEILLNIERVYKIITFYIVDENKIG